MKADDAKRLKELERENSCRAATLHLIKTFEVSERRACAVVGQPRSTQRKPAPVPGDAGVTLTFPAACLGRGESAIWISAVACAVGQAGVSGQSQARATTLP